MLQARLSDPRHGLVKTYWAQVEGVPGIESLKLLERGVTLRDGPTRPARSVAGEPPDLRRRTPLVRRRMAIPTTWIRIHLREGRTVKFGA